MNAIDPRCFASSTINIITTSGGKDSLAQWLRAIENDVPHISVFADTGHEHPQTIEYLDYLESKLGKIIRVKADFTRQIEGKRKFIAEKWPISLVEECGMSTDEAEERIYRALEILKPTGVPFLDLCMWKGRFPSTKARFCTFELKHEPIRTQVIDPALDKYDEVISWQGVRGRNHRNVHCCLSGRTMQTILWACMFIVRSLIGCMRMCLLLPNVMALSLTPLYAGMQSCRLYAMYSCSQVRTC